MENVDKGKKRKVGTDLDMLARLNKSVTENWVKGRGGEKRERQKK